MNDHDSTFSPAGRCVVGLLVGMVVGFLVELFFFSELPPKDTIWRGPLTGAILTAAVAGFFGGRRLPDCIAIPVGWCLGGTIVGILGGAFVFAPVILFFGYPQEFTGQSDPFIGKTFAALRFIGVTCGSVLGCLVGLIVGIARYVVSRRNRDVQSDLSPAASVTNDLSA